MQFPTVSSSPNSSHHFRLKFLIIPSSSSSSSVTTAVLFGFLLVNFSIVLVSHPQKVWNDVLNLSVLHVIYLCRVYEGILEVD